MKLLTSEILERFKKTGFQDTGENPLIIAKFFNPAGSGTWYATEYDPEERKFFGFVTGLAFDEWGYFSLDEMQSVTLQMGLGIERDILFEPTRANDIPEIKTYWEKA